MPITSFTDTTPRVHHADLSDTRDRRPDSGIESAGVSYPDPAFVQATRVSYDTMADEYTARFPDGLGERPVDRALVTAFAEVVRDHGDAPVADVGSGPGYVTARLAALGLRVFGVDVSPRMVALARSAHPGLRFHVGSMTALDLPPQTLGGVIALYSTIHIPDDHLGAVLAEFHRVLVPGGHLLLAFQTGEEDGHLLMTERFGLEISLDYYLRSPRTMAAALTEAGFGLVSRTVLEPVGEQRLPRAYVMARKAE